MKSKFLWISLVIILISSSVYGLLYIGDFNQGIFQNTFFNGSALKLNAGNLSGFYTSPIFDAGNISNWTSISWNATETGELPNYRQGNLMNGNVLLYHLNELSGNITDYSGSNNTGTCFNSTCPHSILNGKLNQAYAFDGVDDYFLENANYGSNYTLSVWVKPFDLVNIENYGRTIIASSPNGTSGYGFWFLINGNRFRVYSYAVNSNSYTLSNYSNISANNWYNLIVSATRNGESKIYVNGVFDKSFISGNQAFYSYITIGDLRPNRKISFNGTIDELSIWNRTLSNQEIKEIYRRGIERLNLSIRACNFSNCSDSNWTDIVGKSPFVMNISDKQFFQYKFNLESETQNYSPEIYNFSVEYLSREDSPHNETKKYEMGSTGGKDNENENEVVYVTSKKDLTKQIILAISIIIIFLLLIGLLVYLMWKVLR